MGGSGSPVGPALRAPLPGPGVGVGVGVERGRGIRLEVGGWALGVAGGSHRHRPGPPLSWNPRWVRR
jgi:hypothetical protein